MITGNWFCPSFQRQYNAMTVDRKATSKQHQEEKLGANMVSSTQLRDQSEENTN